jgi:hypothetical protein
MAELILYAIPAFVLLLVVELLSFRFADDHDHDLVGYESKDTRTSLTMGGGNVAISAVWKAVVVVVYAGLYELTPLRMPPDLWWTTRSSSSPKTSPTTGSTASTRLMAVAAVRGADRLRQQLATARIIAVEGRCVSPVCASTA